MGVDDVTVSKFVPYPGTPLFNELRKTSILSEKLDELSDIISFYSNESISYSKNLTARKLHLWMIWMFLNFYILSFMARPFKLIKNF